MFLIIDHKLLTQEIKETHEAFLMAKKYYKKFLKVYYCIEKRCNDTQVIFVQFFTENKKDNENYSVRLLRHTNKGQYECKYMFMYHLGKLRTMLYLAQKGISSA